MRFKLKQQHTDLALNLQLFGKWPIAKLKTRGWRLTGISIVEGDLPCTGGEGGQAHGAAAAPEVQHAPTCHARLCVQYVSA